MEFQSNNSMSLVDTNKFVARVYRWMSIALILSGVVAAYVGTDLNLVLSIARNPILFYGLIIGEVALVFYITRSINQISFTTAGGLFLVYAIINGITLSFIFLIYQLGSIGTAFFVTAGTFAVMSLYGSVTKTDLTSIGNLSMMGVFGIIIASVVNIFMRSDALSYVISYIGVVVFVGLTAYDTQKIMRYSLVAQENSEADKKAALLGALNLYLDFINLFLFILRILGRRK